MGRSVHCRYCGERGHNRRGCSKIAENAGRGDSWAKDLARRNAETAQTEKRCSYCNGVQHNIKTCPKKKKDKEDLILSTRELRRNFVALLQRYHLGIGTIVKLSVNERYRWGGDEEYKPLIGMILEIDHKNVYASKMNDGYAVLFTLQVLDYGSFADYHRTESRRYHCSIPKHLGKELGLNDHCLAETKMQTVSETPEVLLPEALLSYSWLNVLDEEDKRNVIGHLDNKRYR